MHPLHLKCVHLYMHVCVRECSQSSTFSTDNNIWLRLYSQMQWGQLFGPDTPFSKLLSANIVIAFVATAIAADVVVNISGGVVVVVVVTSLVSLIDPQQILEAHIQYNTKINKHP